ncbi:MAG TPA: carbohydrate-binding protein [Ktedonosporobacter sp.]|nr:carbohydrate-binding protein [Ktedonosporobacter sp.]
MRRFLSLSLIMALALVVVCSLFVGAEFAHAASAKPAAAPAWQPWTAYNIGDQVTFNGATYSCIQAHTSEPGWEPPIVPALWQLVTSGGPTPTPGKTPTPTKTPTPPPTPTPTSNPGSPYVPSGNGQQANVTVTLTWYGFNDNSGTTENQHGSALIAYPKNAGFPVLHNLATEGKGTYTDPITFAARPNDQSTFPIGSVIYVPFTHKYYIMEDECGDTDPQGCLLGAHHTDLWLGPQSASDSTALANCEDNNTPAPDSKQVVINPSPSLPVDATPEFTNNQCTLHTF